LNFGDKKLIDSISNDGLTDFYNKISMGLCAEKTANDFKVTREAQDNFCKMSYQRAINAQKSGVFKEEIVPITIKTKGGEETFTEDEEPKKYNETKIPQLQPVFSKTGTITAANSSKINDGGCSVILMSEAKVKQLDVKPLAKIIGYADAETEPIDFSIAPHYAAKSVLKKTGLKVENIDFFEFN
jgi:acetyl-CoA C-acetyltransferase